jgi:hypothetical protein
VPPLSDSVILAQIRTVLANWNYSGYVTAKEGVLEWMANELKTCTLKDVAQAMYSHLEQGGVIDQVVETRPEWNQWPYHYDFRLPIDSRTVYIEVILQDDDPSDPTIHIVSMHDV